MNKEMIRDKIEKLKKEKNAVILAHYYANDEAQELADYIGDSYYLAKKAKEADADIILFCGVRFMGESAKILNPDKKVIMPDMGADCAMAHMASVEKIEKMREEYEDLAVVCYINSTAELKCHSDVCVTSSNAVKIVNALPNKNIFFIPDGNLGRYVAEQVQGKNIILNDGFCPVHNDMMEEELEALKTGHPNADVLAHPECRKELLHKADFIGSTSAIIDYTENSEKDEFIICTESGVGFELRKKSPSKKFYFVGVEKPCADMKLNTLLNVCDALENEKNTIEIDDEQRKKAIAPLERMLELAEL